MRKDDRWIEKAEKEGQCGQLAERCLFYVAWSDENRLEEVIGSAIKHWKKPFFTFGCLDAHMKGLPTILPLPVFEIPLQYRLKLLLGEVNFCTILDINSLCGLMKEEGFDYTVEKEDERVQICVTDPFGESLILGWGIVGRLLYECLSVRTVLDYTLDALKFAGKRKIT